MPAARTVADQARREIDRDLKRLLKRIISVLRPEQIVLFGSGARGDVHEASDLDLIVVAQTPLPFFERIGQVLNLHRGTRDLDVLVYTPAEFARLKRQRRPFILDAVRRGRVLYRAPSKGSRESQSPPASRGSTKRRTANVRAGTCLPAAGRLGRPKEGPGPSPQGRGALKCHNTPVDTRAG